MSLSDRSQFLQAIDQKALKAPIIIYGAGMDAVWAIEDWRREYGACFDGCVCDGDPHKQGMYIDDVEIVAPKKALALYPGGYIWVAAKDYKFEIIGILVDEMGVQPERILNYEPIIKKTGCRYAEKMFFAYENENSDGGFMRVVHVCDRIGSCPTMEFVGYDSFYDDFCGFRDAIIDELEQSGHYSACIDCREVRQSYYAQDRKLRTYNLATDGCCNFKCIYCKAPVFSPAKRIDGEYAFDFHRILDAFNSKGLLSDELHFDLTSGEICVNPRRDEMLEVASEYGETVSIATNASVYDASIQRILDSKRASLIVSLDCGTEASFNHIKGLPVFKKVIDNLKRYSQAGPGSIELKYIVLPGVNDNPDDIDGFVQLCADIHPGVVTISFDFFYTGVLSEHTCEMIRRLKKELAMNRIFYKYEARASHILRQSEEEDT